MSRANPHQRANGQFYRKLRLDKEYMDVIRFFNKIKKYMKKEIEGVDYEKEDK